MKNKILGDLSTEHFLKEYWQKKPLLIRNALPGFGKELNKEKLIALACEVEAESRLVTFYRDKWQLANGPFKKRDFAKLAGKWTLLVQGVNYFLPQAAALLKKFNFIPHARLDDLMVSFASDGGGVGPHFDSYDVFLLQGTGKRLWQIAKQDDRRLLPNVPLRILENFQPEQEWLLESGDMLYLPPNYAHNGIAVGESMTYSIGFRAPAYQELIHEFLGYLQDHLEIEGMYADPDLTWAEHPARLPETMLTQIASVFKKIRFGQEDIESFLGGYLTEPKAHLCFDVPTVPLEQAAFFEQAKKHGIRLHLKSQMLFTDEKFFMNGEYVLRSEVDKTILIQLADEREVMISDGLDEGTSNLLYAWYLDGYVEINSGFLGDS